jgi:benzoyl-CoA 2,3-epoxidase subunit B
VSCNESRWVPAYAGTTKPLRRKAADMNGINYSDKIPNNVNLAEDRTLQRALEHWQPNYLSWWQDMGPEGAHGYDVYLRTATSVDPQGWAQFGYVKMPDYRWGIFLNPGDPNRCIHFGDHLGETAWQDVPGEHRANLRRIIVTQGDTEPASIEQQRQLGLTAPSMYDLRNLFQINVEEGRHLWAMVYLLHRYFGRDGREEADALLERRSGDRDNPRILGAFNERTADWLAFFMFTYFTDRDGKFQLNALAESSFDPLARTTKFMLTEEAHHMFVGEAGVSRVIQRTCEAMKQLSSDDVDKVRAAGVIDVPTIQRYLNFHYSVTIDLFGADQSSNAAIFYSSGLKGRFEEGKRNDDHRLKGATYKVIELKEGKLVETEVPMLNALNEVLRDDFIRDSVAGIGRWNKVIEKAGLPDRLVVPHKAFNRRIGTLAGARVAPDGRVVDESEWKAREHEWLPSDEDRAFVASLMGRVVEPGRFANWIAPPAMGINRQPVDFEYVRFG